jgi:hypothetical protein
MPKFEKPSSFDIIARMKALTATDTDAALARYLGITPPALVQWRTKNIMPMTYCIEIAERTGASLDYIYLGIGKGIATAGAAIDPLLLEVVLQRRLPDLGAGLAQLATRVAGDYAGALQNAAVQAQRANLSVEAAGLLVWLAEKGGEAEDVAVDAGIVNEAVRNGMLERVTIGTDGAELLVLTKAGADFGKRSQPQK